MNRQGPGCEVACHVSGNFDVGWTRLRFFQPPIQHPDALGPLGFARVARSFWDFLGILLLVKDTAARLEETEPRFKLRYRGMSLLGDPPPKKNKQTSKQTNKQTKNKQTSKWWLSSWFPVSNKDNTKKSTPKKRHTQKRWPVVIVALGIIVSSAFAVHPCRRQKSRPILSEDGA